MPTAGAVEEPKYEIEKDYGAFEVRRYAPVVVAETVVGGEFGAGSSEGFRRLAGYIFGGNTAKQKIAMTAPVGAEARPPSTKLAMTAPVGQERQGDGWGVTFTMPASESLATLPVPRDPKVALRAVAARRVAAVTFSGRWDDGRFDDKAMELTRARGQWAHGDRRAARLRALRSALEAVVLTAQ